MSKKELAPRLRQDEFQSYGQLRPLQFKVCTRCVTVRYSADFYPSKRGLFGRRSVCIHCTKNAPQSERDATVARVKRWRQANLERARKIARDGYHRNAEKIKAKRRGMPRSGAKEWVANNIEKVRGYKRKWQAAHVEQHRKTTLAAQRRNRERDRPRRTALENKRRTLKLGCPTHHTQQEWETLCERTGNKCLKCHRTDLKLSRDHVVPLSRGGGDGIENIQPLCRGCNASKNAKTIDYRV